MVDGYTPLPMPAEPVLEDFATEEEFEAAHAAWMSDTRVINKMRQEEVPNISIYPPPP